MLSVRYFCQTLMKFQFSRQIFEKYSNTKFQENSLVEAEFFFVEGGKDE